ncbi:MAG: VCBS repeat-containing protein [Saprospiraceae bacterium]|nr:VCBS repeat-containing protein [Saprospiraceae bacterium]
MFRQLDAEATNVDFVNQLDENESFNIIQYLYYYNGGGVAVGDLNNDGLPDLYFTANQQPNKLYLNKGNLQFEDITTKAGVAGNGLWKTGVAMADVNGDGWLDIYVCQVGDYKSIKGRNELYINNKDLTFTESAAIYGLDFKGFSTQSAFFDYDADGDLDLYLLNHSVHAPENYGEASIRKRRDPLSGDRLYRNDRGKFTDVSEQAGIYGSRIGYGLGVAAADFNDDGCPDLYISNDFHENDYLYYNNCDGTFREAISASMGHTSTFSMGSDAADFNNDGRLDLLTLDMKPEDAFVLKSSVGADPYNIYRYKLSFGYYFQYPRNMLQMNLGQLQGREAQFAEIGQLAGVDATDWSWSALFCDLDGDGWKDIFIGNGIQRRPNDLDYLKFTGNTQVQKSGSDLDIAAKMPNGLVPNCAFRNRGDLTFEPVGTSWGLDLIGSTNGAAYADLDGDGDLDLVTNNLNAPAAVFENRSQELLKNNYLRIRLKGVDGNPFGIGARVVISSGGIRQTQEMQTTRGFQSSVEPVLTFGLGAATLVDELTIRWPDGHVQRLYAVQTNQTLELAYKKEEGKRLEKNTERPVFEEVTAESGLNFQHIENDFTDFDREPLIPHALSTQGPRLAEGDVNGDGLVDVFVCGPKGQAGAIFIQSGQAGNFKSLPQQALENDRLKEDTDAAFFDADSDGDLDLYVVSGGGEAVGESDELLDRLYLNDGKGNFSLSENALPLLYLNGSCVVPLDFNGDGALDLFVGSRAVTGSFGLSPASVLLQNDGKGTFSDRTAAIAPSLSKAGMVTDAALVNISGKPWLVVVGEWMPVTAFSITERWKKVETPDSGGWWNTVLAHDFNGDGDDELLLGNMGLNSDLRASKEEPVSLYVHDFDGNYFSDPILVYYKQNQLHSYATLDELSGSMPILRKKFTLYTNFAKSTFKELFEAGEVAKAQRLDVQTFASAYATSNGDGTFSLEALPAVAQVAPIFAFAALDTDGDGTDEVLATGNFYHVHPAPGRYDASWGHFLKKKANGGFEEIGFQKSGFASKGEGRGLAVIKTGNDKLLVISARNNLPVQVFKVQ